MHPASTAYGHPCDAPERSHSCRTCANSVTNRWMTNLWRKWWRIVVVVVVAVAVAVVVVAAAAVAAAVVVVVEYEMVWEVVAFSGCNYLPHSL